MAPDPGKALKLMRDAAILGSADAQRHLGLQYEIGSGVELNIFKLRN
jgi:TPR repeat protein